MNVGSGMGELYSTAPHPAATGSIPSIPPKKFRGKFFNVAEVNQRRWLEESGQWFENVDRTILVQASGKPALQKNVGSGINPVHRKYSWTQYVQPQFTIGMKLSIFIACSKSRDYFHDSNDSSLVPA